jgi:hypothetical protein
MGLNPSRVSYEPYIFHGTGVVAGQGSQRQGSASGGEGEGSTGRTELGDGARGDVEVYGLWKKGEGCVLDIQVTDTDAKSYASSSSEKVLERAAKAKKAKYLDACLERRRSFTPLVYSVDGMACKEARAWEKRVASLIASKMDRSYSEMVGFVRARMSLAIVRMNTHLLRGSRVPFNRRPAIQDEAAFETMDCGRW